MSIRWSGEIFFKAIEQKSFSVSDENYDVTYTFNLVAGADGDNETETENVTAIRVNMADIVVKKYSVGKIIIEKLSILLSYYHIYQCRRCWRDRDENLRETLQCEKLQMLYKDDLVRELLHWLLCKNQI